MNNNNIETLIIHLEQEIIWVSELNTLLIKEKEILANRQFNQLQELVQKKEELSDKLRESSEQRMHLINHPNSTTQTAHLALKEFLKECSTEEAVQINLLNSQLGDLLTTCRELNSVNGQVIANNLYVRQEIVNILTGNKTDSLNVYTSTGNIKSSNDNKHHQEA